MTCAEHYACDCFQAEAQYHRDRIEALTAQVEANRARYESARRERDEARAEVEALRGVIACRTCTGWGFLGYPDQPEPCPTCGDLREAVVEAAGGY